LIIAEFGVWMKAAIGIYAKIDRLMLLTRILTCSKMGETAATAEVVGLQIIQSEFSCSDEALSKFLRQVACLSKPLDSN